MPKYVYLGTEVELVPGQWFTSHINFYDPTDPYRKRIKSGQLGSTLIEIEDELPHNVVSLADQAKKKLAQAELLKEEEYSEDEDGNFIPVVRKDVDHVKTETVEAAVEKIDINALSEAEILKKDIAGLTPTTLKAFIRNRPAMGYESFDHFLELNKGKIRQQLHWEEMNNVFHFDGAVAD